MADDGREPGSRSEEGESGPRIADDLSAYMEMTTDFYRGEIDRTTTWRARLDQTTNWAVVVVAAILTWAFTSADNPHYVMIIGMFATTAFLLMEANRYREYDVWRDRVRLLQSELFADVYDGESTAGREWEQQLSDELRRPSFDMSYWEALNHRLRRSYLALLFILLVAWIARITVFEAQEPWQATASIFMIPGELVVGFVAVFYAAVVAITIWSAREDRTQEFEA